ncbi:AAA family ATPase [Myxococcus sp. Y35]|uniref:AAA family ATPase n=1 Tax=Pseudomyxococcus flavus TaxID=3115648 RepID=UPI003CF1CED9
MALFTSLGLKNYRGFRNLSVPDLTRINLFVGTNNSGKTSFLEAVELLAASPNLMAISRSANRRGEYILQQGEERSSPEVDISHLFHGHTFTEGSAFALSGERDTRVTFECAVVATSLGERSSQQALPLPETLESTPSEDLALLLTFDGRQEILPLTPSGGLPRAPSVYRRAVGQPSPEQTTPPTPVTFLTTESLEAFRLAKLWDSIVLTQDEEKVISALRIIEPSVERIAFLTGDTPRYASLGAIVIKLAGLAERVPLGSMGDGIRRLLALTMALARSERGYFLIDEIDTGLHHSVMLEMWRLVIGMASTLDIQVFATTHSLDCVRSLAWLVSEEPDLCSDLVSLHRLSRGGDTTVRYSAQELTIAAHQHIEVR